VVNNWDDELLYLQIKIDGKHWEGRQIGNKLFIQCETYEVAQLVRRLIKEKGITLTCPEDKIGITIPHLANLVILPEEER